MRSVRVSAAVIAALVTIVPVAGLSAQTPTVPLEQLASRRQALFDRIPDGIFLVPSASGSKEYREIGFHQDPTFYWLTGLERSRYAVLLLDGTKRRAVLFSPDGMPESMVRAGASVALGSASAKALGLDGALSRASLDGAIDSRLAEDPGLILFTEAPDTPRFHQPSGPLPLHDPGQIFGHAVASRWPEATIKTTAAALILRGTKDAHEMAALRRVGEASAEAFLAGMAAIKPSVFQRTVEGRVVASCLESGADGVSFWPWAMSGPNAPFPKPFESFNDYYHLDRQMVSGELVRLDVGCESDHYAGDVGRTVPVSGRYTPGQREAYDLLVTAFEGGLSVIRPGVARDQVIAASLAAARQRAPELVTPLGRRAAEILLGEGGTDLWELHGIGLLAAEPEVDTLQVGRVFAFEPMLDVDGVGLFLEDMVLVTESGYEILTPGLPYRSEEIEALMNDIGDSPPA